MRCPVRLGGGWSWTCPRANTAPQNLWAVSGVGGASLSSDLCSGFGTWRTDDPFDQSTPTAL